MDNIKTLATEWWRSKDLLQRTHLRKKYKKGVDYKYYVHTSIQDIMDMYKAEHASIKYNQRGHRWVPDTPAEANIRKVRKELAILIKAKQADGDSQAVDNARKEINLKYGKGWRERGLCVNDKDQWLPLDQYPIK